MTANLIKECSWSKWYRPVTFLKDFAITIKSRENAVHTLAYITLDLLQTIRIGILSDATFWRVVVDTAALVIINGGQLSEVRRLYR